MQDINLCLRCVWHRLRANKYWLYHVLSWLEPWGTQQYYRVSNVPYKFMMKEMKQWDWVTWPRSSASHERTGKLEELQWKVEWSGLRQEITELFKKLKAREYPWELQTCHGVPSPGPWIGSQPLEQQSDSWAQHACLVLAFPESVSSWQMRATRQVFDVSV